MFTSFLSHGMVRRGFAAGVFAGAGLMAAGAQTGSAAASAQPVNFQTSAVPFTGSTLFTTNGQPQYSSSVANYDQEETQKTQLASVEKAVLLPDANAMQYGQRRRYGAPRYRGSNTNADGSEKYVGYAGGGFTIPTGDLHNYDTTSWGFQVGAGRNFNRHFGVNLEFDWDEFGLQGNVLQQQSFVEDPENLYGLQGATDGYSHIWSLSVQPIYNLTTSDTWGTYVTAGGGYYHKITTFTTPQEVVGYDYFGYPEAFVANEPFDSYTSNSAGVDAGFGVTYKFSRFANERFYAEARFVHTFNQYKPGIDGSNYNNYASSGYNYPTTNLYPANSRTSTYVPVKFGIRF
jgi:hypothetical protein